MKICILGATSHIAKGLIDSFIRNRQYELLIYAREESSFQNFPFDIKKDVIRKMGITRDFAKDRFDVIINCIGISDPQKLINSNDLIFQVTEEYDNAILDYLKKRPNTIYINFSSGAVYGRKLDQNIKYGFKTLIDINSISQNDYYGIAKINAETKHRSCKNLNIIDLRVFSYFSRYISLDGSFFLTDIINAIKNNGILITKHGEIIRDFISPNDLFQLILKCIKKIGVNEAFDVISKKPITKSEILKYFTNEYGLKYEEETNIMQGIPDGRSNYFSTYNKAFEILGFRASKTSLETIAEETSIILNQKSI